MDDKKDKKVKNKYGVKKEHLMKLIEFVKQEEKKLTTLNEFK